MTTKTLPEPNCRMCARLGRRCFECVNARDDHFVNAWLGPIAEDVRARAQAEPNSATLAEQCLSLLRHHRAVMDHDPSRCPHCPGQAQPQGFDIYDLVARLKTAAASLNDKALDLAKDARLDNDSVATERARLSGKADGVRLALSYIDEMLHR